MTDEEQRLARLRALMVLDTEPEPLFDSLARMASQACGTPIALISLIDAGRQWFKANVGLASVRETPREVAFCDHAIRSDSVMGCPTPGQTSVFATTRLCRRPRTSASTPGPRCA
jgi:hypothetical protein